MVYRIDRKHFLSHFIDYFTLEEITHCQYAILSASITNQGVAENVAKINDLYPTPDIVENYYQYKDKEILRKMYWDYLEPDEEDKIKLKRGESYFVWNVIYKTFLNPLVFHHDIVIVCDEDENVYIDILCEYLKKRFKLEVIDLNELFKTGHVAHIHIDRKEIYDKAVDIRRATAREKFYNLASTRDGKEKLISTMRFKEKVKKLKELGVDITPADKKNIDKLLLDEWCAADEDDD